MLWESYMTAAPQQLLPPCFLLENNYLTIVVMLLVKNSDVIPVLFIVLCPCASHSVPWVLCLPQLEVFIQNSFSVQYR